MAEQLLETRPQATRNPHGSFIWYELLTSDPDDAADFYGTLIGWTTRPHAAGGADGYRIFEAPDDGVAGLMRMPEAAAAGGARSGWFGYVGVDDVDRATEAARAAGAKVTVEPQDIPGVGRFAMISDPWGAPLYLMRGSSDQPSHSFAPDVDRHCSWNELSTDDVDGAVAFHAGLFGWTEGERMEMGAMGPYQMLDMEGRSFGAVMRRMADGPPSAWNFYFRVPSIDAAKARAEQAGGRIFHGPGEIPGGEFILIGADRQGATFALVGPR